VDIDPTCTFASLQVMDRNQHVLATLRDALAGTYPWPVLVTARDPRMATRLLDAAANYVRGDLARSVHIARTSLLRQRNPSLPSTFLNCQHEWLTCDDVLLVDGIDDLPINAEAIIALARAMATMHANKRPIVTVASLANDAPDGLLGQLTTRFAGGRPLAWQSTTRKTRRAA
jgi:hypothetical protein